MISSSTGGLSVSVAQALLQYSFKKSGSLKAPVAGKHMFYMVNSAWHILVAGKVTEAVLSHSNSTPGC